MGGVHNRGHPRFDQPPSHPVDSAEAAYAYVADGQGGIRDPACQ